MPAEPRSWLMGALLKVQQEVPKIQKQAIAKIESQRGASYSYRYVPLDVLMETVQPSLSKHGLVWIALPCNDAQGRPALNYKLVHAASGESEEGTMTLMLTSQDDPKGHGSAITYARRYSITAVLNLVAAKDDDGSAARSRGTARGRVERPADVSAQPPQQTQRLATAKQRGMLNAKAAEKGLPPTRLADIVLAASGSAPLTWASQSAAEDWLRRAMDRLPAQLVDTILASLEAAEPEAPETQESLVL